MAFWGVEVKPGKPITHSCENARGRLRISQATLGIGEATSKTILQCNVGQKSPVLLCALLPNKTESCQLDLEFEEPDDVIFSVIGPRSVYLTGYYVQKIRLSNPQSDTESYGLDIENTHTEGSSYGSDEEEKYDDSFINDGAELQFSPRPLVSNEEETDEETAEDEPKDKKGHGGRHRKKYRVIESDSDPNSHEKGGEDEDDFSLSALKSNRTTTMSDDDGEKIQMGDGPKEDGVCGIEPKQNVDCLDTNGQVEEGVTKLPIDDEVNTELPKETETVEEINVTGEEVLSGDTIHEKNANDTIEQMQSLDVAKPEKKRKKRSKKEDKTCNIHTNDNMDISENSEDGQKSKKVRIELEMVGINEEGTIKKCQNVLENDDKYEEGSQHVGNLTKLGEICSEEIGSESSDIAKEDVSVQVLPHDDSVKEDLPAETELYEDRLIDDTINKEILASDSQSKKKTKKKKNTPVDQTNDNMDISENSEDGQKSKKIRNELEMVGINAEGTIKKCQNVLENDDKYEEGSQHVDNLTKLGEICSEEIGSESRDIAKQDVSMQVLPHDDSVKEDLPAETGLYQDQLIDDTINEEILASDSQSKKKTKKKKKTPVEKDLTNTSVSKETMSENVPFISRKILPQGLIIEELSHGPSDGKTAVLGKKVKIYYTAMVKVTGHVFESNVGQTAYQFQLGNEELIDGWNIGINGMRVGDKRRLTIPPSLGFGDQGLGEDVPPNSWLVYEIELVGVRK